MYAWLWHRLPGPAPLRALLCAAALLGIVALCFGWLFPALSDSLLAPVVH